MGLARALGRETDAERRVRDRGAKAQTVSGRDQECEMLPRWPARERCFERETLAPRTAGLATTSRRAVSQKVFASTPAATVGAIFCAARPDAPGLVSSLIGPTLHSSFGRSSNCVRDGFDYNVWAGILHL